MNINTLGACRSLGVIFFIAVTMIEVTLFCLLFDILADHWIKIVITTSSALLFNGVLWLFAIGYHKTSENISKHK